MARDDEMTLMEVEMAMLFEQNQIDKIIRPIKSGKEASVYLCRRPEGMGGGFAAAKVYRPRLARGFRHNAGYQADRNIKDPRMRKAIQKHTAKGRELQFGMWINREYQVMKTMFEAGAPVPRPLARAGNAVLMEYIGGVDAPAPMLKNIRLPEDHARTVFAEIRAAIELLLEEDFVHADLSPFNVLLWEGRPVLIDFPQATDVLHNRNAFKFLVRDIGNIVRYFERHGVHADPYRIAIDMWMRVVGVPVP